MNSIDFLIEENKFHTIFLSKNYGALNAAINELLAVADPDDSSNNLSNKAYLLIAKYILTYMSIQEIELYINTISNLDVKLYMQMIIDLDKSKNLVETTIKYVNLMNKFTCYILAYNILVQLLKVFSDALIDETFVELINITSATIKQIANEHSDCTGADGATLGVFYTFYANLLNKNREKLLNE